MRAACAVIAFLCLLTAADGSRAQALQEICGQVLFYPGSLMMRHNGTEVFIDDPKDPKGIYPYLDNRPQSEDHVCYCVSGKIVPVRARHSAFTELSALRTCDGKVIK